MTTNQNYIITRLTALWALNECGLGGFMHALGSPFTGILVGGISILLITLIASNSSNIKNSIVKALCIVLLVKLTVSPHSPVTAYFAVSFQAFLSIALYNLFSINKVTILCLGMLTFFESAVQKILTLTIIYGKSLWLAIDTYLDWITSSFNITSFKVSSTFLAITYISFYIFTGLMTGFIIIKIIKSIDMIDTIKIDFNSIDNATQSKNGSQSRNSIKLAKFWLITILIILLPLLLFGGNQFGWKAGLYVVARSLLIIGLWYLLLAPIIMKGINIFLGKRETKYKAEIDVILKLLPHLKSIISYAWKESKSLKGINRVQSFLAKSIVYSIHFNPSNH